MENKPRKILFTTVKAIWIFISALVLSVTLYAYDGKTNSDIWIFLTWLMLPLSFPASLLVSLSHMLLAKLFSITITTTYVSLLVEWLAYFCLGYFQWFVLIPNLLRRIRIQKMQL
jgi:hypothetical protein